MAAELIEDFDDAAAVIARLAENPTIAAEKDHRGWYPLHHGMVSGAPPDAMAAVLRAHPAAAAEAVDVHPDADRHQRDNETMFALHLGMAHGAPAESIVAVLNAHSAAAAVPNGKGCYPLHLGMSSPASVEAIVAVLNAHASAAAKKCSFWERSSSGHDHECSGMYPLHCGMKHEAPTDAILAVLNAHPAAAAEKDSDGYHPLHYAMAKNASVEAIMAVLYAHPAAAAEKDRDRKYPLHWALQTRASVEGILAVLNACTAATGEKDLSGATPLHYAMSMQAPGEVVLALLKEHPAAATVTDEVGCYPLHYGMGQGAATEAILAVLNAHPAAAAQKDASGKYPLQYGLVPSLELDGLERTPIQPARAASAKAILAVCKAHPLPLHHAMEHKVPAEIILTLFNAHTAAAAAKDGDGCYPLHFGMANYAASEVVLAVLKAHPAAAAGKDIEGSYPIHYGMNAPAPAEAILAVLNAHPAAAAEKNDAGRCPLHYGMEKSAPVEAILAVLKAHPGAATEKDTAGCYPLHCGMSIHGAPAPAEAILAVLNAHPTAAAEKNDDGELPLHLGMGHGAATEAILAVLNAHPGAVAEKDNCKQYPLHAGMSFPASAEAILTVLKANPDCTAFMDLAGMTPLHHGMQNKAPIEAILAVLNANPGATRVEDTDKFFPLHYGMMSGDEINVEAVLAVLNEYPGAAAKKAVYDFFPLHCGMKMQSPTEIIVAVLNAHPAAATARSNLTQSALRLGANDPSTSPTTLRIVLAAQSEAAGFDENDLEPLFKLAGNRDGDTDPWMKVRLELDCQLSLMNSVRTKYGYEANADPHFGRLRALLDATITWEGASRLTPGELCPGWTALMVAAALEAEEAFFWLLNQHAADPSFVHGDPELLNRKAVDSAKASHTASILKWGQAWGRLLGRYEIEEGTPKHVSATCCLVFATDLEAATEIVVTHSDKSTTAYPDYKSLCERYHWSPQDADLKKEFDSAVETGGVFQEKKVSMVTHDTLALKFMYDPKAVERELGCRQRLDGTPTVVSILTHYNGTYITAEALKHFPQIRLSTEQPGDSTILDHLLVMVRGSIDLGDSMSHGDFAGKNMLRVRSISASVAKCLQDIHAIGRITHGDVKKGNFVLLPNGEYAAIDLDAAAEIDGSALAGPKSTSSGCVPPEQAAIVLHRRRLARAVFNHIAPATTVENDKHELSKETFSRFCADIGLDGSNSQDARWLTHFNTQFVLMDEDGDNTLSVAEFCTFFADPSRAKALNRYHDEKHVGDSNLDAAVKERLQAEFQQAVDIQDWSQVAAVSAKIETLDQTNVDIPNDVFASAAHDTW